MANKDFSIPIRERGINMKKILTNSFVAVFVMMSVVFGNHSAGAVNEYYEPSGAPAAGSALSSSVIRSEFVSVGGMAEKLPALSGNGGKPVFINSGGTALESKSIADTNTALGTELTSRKDATGGYAGLTLFKINFKNALNTVTSFFTNANTVARTYTFQDRDGTIADNTDISTLTSAVSTKADSSALTSGLALKADLASPTFTGVPAAPTAATSTDTTQVATTEFVQNVFTDLGGGVGVGQTWQIPTRVAGTVYQNTTGRPIQVLITAGAVSGGAGSVTFKVGTTASITTTLTSVGFDASATEVPRIPISAVIPDQYYYSLLKTGSPSISWAELRE